MSEQINPMDLLAEADIDGDQEKLDNLAHMFGLIARMCEAKSKAIAHRRKGETGLASIYEGRANGLYQCIPVTWRAH